MVHHFVEFQCVQIKELALLALWGCFPNASVTRLVCLSLLGIVRLWESCLSGERKDSNASGRAKLRGQGGRVGAMGTEGGAELARNFPFVLLKPFLTNNIAVPSHFPPTNYLPNNSFSHKLLKSLVNENEVKWWSSFCKCWFNWAAAILEQFVRGWLWNIGSLISQPAFSLCFTLGLKLQMLNKYCSLTVTVYRSTFLCLGNFGWLCHRQRVKELNAQQESLPKNSSVLFVFL